MLLELTGRTALEWRRINFNAILKKKDWTLFLKELNEYITPTSFSQWHWLVALMGQLTGYNIKPPLFDQTMQTFGSNHPQMALVENNYAILCMTYKEWNTAIPPSIRANEINFNIVSNVFSMASESLKLKYIDKTELYRDILLSAVMGAKAEGDKISEALKWVMRMKGIVLDSMIGEREVIRRGLSPELTKIHEHLQQLARQLLLVRIQLV